MLGSLVVAQMEMMACEGLDGPINHGAVWPPVVRSKARWRYVRVMNTRCDTEIMNK